MFFDVLAISVVLLILFFILYVFWVRLLFIKAFMADKMPVARHRTQDVLAGCVSPKWCFGGAIDGVGYYLMQAEELGGSTSSTFLVVVASSNKHAIENVFYTNSFYASGVVKELGLGFRPANPFDRIIACDGVCYFDNKVFYVFKMTILYRSLFSNIFHVVENNRSFF